VMFNKVQLVTFPHVILAAYMTAGAFMLGVAAYLYKSRNPKHRADRDMHRLAIRIGAWTALVAGLGVAVSGDFQGKVMTEVQPMKMAAAEGLYETTTSAPFSVLTLGSLDGANAQPIIEVHGLLSFLGTGSFNGTVEGINPLRERYIAEFGQDPGATYYSAGDYTPVIPITYWSFRFMMGLGLLVAAGASVILWVTRRTRRVQPGNWVTWLGVSIPLFAILANSFGWIFTEMGRQPWVVYGLMTTENAVSPGVSTTEAWISLVTLTLLYAVLAVIEVGLLLKYIKKGPDPYVEQPEVPLGGHDDDRPMAFAY
jgi:cytochrome d ubiquinol oxidase subunit I